MRLNRRTFIKTKLVQAMNKYNFDKIETQTLIKTVTYLLLDC